MSSSLPPGQPPNNNEKLGGQDSSASADPTQPDVVMDITPDPPAEETWADIPQEVMELDTNEIMTRVRLIDNDIKVRRHVLDDVD